MEDNLNILNFEDWSDKIVPARKKSKKLYEYAKPTKNNNLICEDSLARMLAPAENKDFAVFSAYRKEFTKAENIIRNRKMRDILNTLKIGVHQLVGHWQEAPDGIPYEKADPSMLNDMIERSYLVVRPDDLPLKDFTWLVSKCMTVDGKTQDAAVIHRTDDNGYYLMDADMKFFSKIGSKLTLGQFGQAYSQHVKKTNTPFRFEGEEIPSSNSGSLMFAEHNILT